VRINDAVAGVVLILFGLAIVWHAQSFPDMPGQNYGPALFPTVIGVGFILCGAVLTLGGLRRRAVEPWLHLEPWAASRARLLDAASVIGGLLFYILLSDQLGFLITAMALLTFWLVRFRGGHLLSSLPIAAGATLVVDYAFRSMLLVPLPIGPFAILPW
jgi:putative tricarboxylic transport membrane protein